MNSVTCVTAGWLRTERSGTAAELHEPDGSIATGRRVERLTVTGPAVVLGSTQRPSVLDVERATAAGLGVCRRRSGGGAVLLTPGEHLWLDVVIGRDDPLWVADVGVSMAWLGEVWSAALRATGHSPVAVHDGPPARREAGAVCCFAGLGPGEVSVGARKVVGISQRRTRGAARFQCIVHRSFDSETLVALLSSPADRAIVSAPLDEVGCVGDLAALEVAFAAALPVP